MSIAGAGEPAGSFLSARHGRTFCLRHPAGGTRAAIYIAPFAEEMNRSRRMGTLLAAALAARGVSALIPDLHGTGESDGDFADARWSLWIGDLEAAIGAATEAGARQVTLIGVRLGALLALEAARRHPRVVEHIVLWQPVVNGQQFMNQFLRLKLAAGMRQTSPSQETTASLRVRLAAGEGLEVAGYELNHELVTAIDALNLATLAAATPPITWLEVSTADPPALNPASVRAIENLRASGIAVQASAVAGEPFWSLQEITIAPALVEATVQAVAPEVRS